MNKIYKNDINFVNSHSYGLSVEYLDGGYVFRFPDGTTSLSKWGTVNIKFAAIQCRAKMKDSCIIQIYVYKKDPATGSEYQDGRYVVLGYDGTIIGDGKYSACDVRKLCHIPEELSKSDYFIVIMKKESSRANSQKIPIVYSCAGAKAYAAKSASPTIDLIPINKDKLDEGYLPVAQIQYAKGGVLINLVNKKTISENDDNIFTCVYNKKKQKSPYLLEKNRVNYGGAPTTKLIDLNGNTIIDNFPSETRWIHIDDNFGENDYLICADTNNIIHTILVLDENGNFQISKLHKILDLDNTIVQCRINGEKELLECGLFEVRFKSARSGNRTCCNYLTSDENVLFQQGEISLLDSDHGEHFIPFGEYNREYILFEYNSFTNSKVKHINFIKTNFSSGGKYEILFDEPALFTTVTEPLMKMKLVAIRCKNKENFLITSNIRYGGDEIKSFGDMFLLEHWVDGIYTGDAGKGINGEEAIYIKDNGKLFFFDFPKALYDLQKSKKDGNYLYECEYLEYSKYLTERPNGYLGSRMYFGYIFLFKESGVDVIALEYSPVGAQREILVHKIYHVDDIYDTNMDFPIVKMDGKYSYLKPGYSITPNMSDLFITMSPTREWFDDVESAYKVGNSYYFPVTVGGSNHILNVNGYSIN